MFPSAALPYFRADAPVPSLNTLRTGLKVLWQGLGPHPSTTGLVTACVSFSPSHRIGLKRTHLHFKICFQFPSALPTYVSLCFCLCSGSRAAQGRVGDILPARPRGVAAGPGPRPLQLRGAPAGGTGGLCPGRVPRLGAGNSPPQDFSHLEWVQSSSWQQKPFPFLASGFLADKGAHAGLPSTLHARGSAAGVGWV